MALYVRIETSFYSHRKTLRLRAVIGNDAFWVPPRLWSYAAANQPDGNFSDYTAQEMADLIDYRMDATVMLEALLAVRFLDAAPIRIHDWHEYNGILDFFSKRAKKAADARWKKAKQIGAEQIRADQSRSEPSIASSITGVEKLSTIKGSTVVPLLLSTPEFRAVWVKWLEHLKQKRKSPSLHSQDLQLRKLATLGPEKAVQTINHCIEHNWQGIYEQRTETDQRNHKPTVSEIRNSHILGADASGSKAVAVIAARRERDEREAQARKAKAAGNGVATQVAGPGGDAP